MLANKKSPRFTLTITALKEGITLSGEATLPRWLLRAIALGAAHVLATQVFGLDGVDTLFEAARGLVA